MHPSECKKKLSCPKCDFFQKKWKGIGECTAYSVIVFPPTNFIREKCKEVHQNIFALLLKTQTYLHSLQQDEMNGIPLNPKRKQLLELCKEYWSVRYELEPLITGCEFEEKDCKNLIERIMSQEKL